MCFRPTLLIYKIQFLLRILTPYSCTGALEVVKPFGRREARPFPCIWQWWILRARLSRFLISRKAPCHGAESQRHPSPVTHVEQTRCWDLGRPAICHTTYLLVVFLRHHALQTKLRYHCILCCCPFSRRTFGRRRVSPTSATAGPFSSCVQERCFLGCFLNR